MGNMKSNAETANALVAAVLEELVKEEHAELVAANHLSGATRWSVCTNEGFPGGKEAKERLGWLLGWGGEKN